MKNILDWSDIVAFLEARIGALSSRTDSPAKLQLATFIAAKAAIIVCWNFDAHLAAPGVVPRITCQWCANEFQPPALWVVTCSDECEKLRVTPSAVTQRLVERAFYELSILDSKEKV